MKLEVSEVRRRLLRWFDRERRDLPWRTESTPYRVWVSEIMLQQTQVATVIDYFQRFMQRFPTLAALAKAEEQDVLVAWEGLGYYRRARQMHAAAKKIMADHGGIFPDDFQQILSLPGIGRYTAGAIASIALGQARPILEGNTIRLYSRLLNYGGDVSTRAAQDQLWNFAEQLVAGCRRPGDLNQALMELGSQVCRVRSPDCLRCPLQQACCAWADGTVSELPRSTRKTDYVSIHEALAILTRRGRYLVRRCGTGERWAGLWDFPRFSCDATPQASSLAEQVEDRMGLEVDLTNTGWTCKHAVTRYRIQLHCFVATAVRGKLARERDLRWVTESELGELPLSVTGRKVALQLPKLMQQIRVR